MQRNFLGSDNKDYLNELAHEAPPAKSAAQIIGEEYHSLP